METEISIDINKTITLTNRKENQQVVNEFARQARKKLFLYSRNLAPELYDTSEFADAIKQLCLNNKYATIQIVVTEARQISQRGHRLLNLGGALSSFIHLRAAAKKYERFNKNLLIADIGGYYYRHNDVRYEAVAHYNDYLRSKEWLDEFNKIWREAKPDTNLRRLSL